MVKLLQKLVPAIRGLTALPHIRFVVSTLLLMAGCIYVWIQIPQGLYAGTDGRLFKGLIAMQQEFSTPFALNGMNVLQGMGNTFHPMNIWLHPSYLPFHFFGEETAVLISTVISWLALVLATYCLSRCWGLGEGSATVAAQASTLLFYPFQYEFGLGINYLLNPGVAFIAATMFAALGVLSDIGDKFTKNEKPLKEILILALLLLWGVSADPIWWFVHALFFSPFLSIPFFSTPLKGKFLLLLLIALIFMIGQMSGILSYLVSLFSYTARTFAPSEVIGHAPSATLIFSQLSMPLRWQHFFMIAGIFLNLYSAEKSQKNLSIVLLGYSGILIILSCLFILSVTFTAPAPAYIEQACAPFYFVGSISGCSVFLISIKRAWEKNKISNSQIFHPSNWLNNCCLNSAMARLFKYLIYSLSLGLVACYIFYLMPTRKSIYIENADTINVPESFQFLLKDLIVRKNTPFKGYVLIDEAVEYLQGSRKYSLYLWKNNIPTINEYSQLITPFSFLFASRLMAGNQFGGTNGWPIFYINQKIARILCVAVIISGEPLDISDFQLVETITLPTGNLIYVYKTNKKVPLLNPLKWEFMPSLDETYKRIKSSSFDPDEIVLIQEALPENLVKINSISFAINSPGYRVSVRSGGLACVILPVQFTHALEAKMIQGDKVRLFRANGLLTGVMVKGDVEFALESKFSLFNARNRKKDMADLKEMVLGLDARPLPVPSGGDRIDLSAGRKRVVKLLSETKMAQSIKHLIKDFSRIPEYRFKAQGTSCQHFASNSKKYVDNLFLSGFGDAPPWLQEKNGNHSRISMDGSFLGVGWGEIGQLSTGPVRRLDYRHDEGIVLFRVDPQKSYRVKLRYDMHMPQHVANDLTVGFNGVKAEVAETGQEGEFAWTEYLLPKSIAGSCNGWVELLISTRGKTYRPASKRNTPWTGFHLLLNSITVTPEP